MKIFKKIKQVFINIISFLYWNNLIAFLKKINMMTPKTEDDITWMTYEKERKAHWKKSHLFLYIFEKIEPYLMWIGFIIFLGDSILKLLLPFGLYIILRAFSGGAMGLGLGSWLLNKKLRKDVFISDLEVKHFLDRLHEALENLKGPKIEKHSPRKGVN